MHAGGVSGGGGGGGGNYGVKDPLEVRQEHNDPLGQTHNLAISEHCFRLKFVLF